MKTSACRRSSSATMGGWLASVETTVTRTPRRCTASTSERKSPSAREQHDLIDVLGEFHGIHGEFHIHAAPHLAAAGRGVNELLGELGDDGVPVIVEPIDQWAD